MGELPPNSDLTDLEMLDISKTSLRIKCTIPWHSEPVAKTILNLFSECLTQARKRTSAKYPFRARTLTEAIRVKTSFEFVAEVEPSKKLIDLFTLMQQFFEKVRDQRFRRDMMPVIHVSSPLFFNKICFPAHRDIPIQSLYFGSSINSGALGVHWTVEFYRPSFRDDKDRKVPFRNGDGERLQDKIKVFFLHDQGTVSIKFETKEKTREDRQAKSEDIGKCKNVEYTVKFYLQAIRRILIDPLSIDDDKQTLAKFRFHFELSCPPEVKSFVENEKKPEQRFGDGTRMVHMGRGWGPKDGKTEFPNKKTVAESTIVTLEFHPGANRNILFEILSRLRVRAGVPIEFVSMDLVNLHHGHFWELNPYVKNPLSDEVREGFKHELYTQRIEWAAPNRPTKVKTHNNVCAAQFRLRYIIEALMSRGAKVKNQLWINAETWGKFLQIVCQQYKKNNDKTLIVMENVINRVDEMSFPVQSIFRIMLEEFTKYEELKKMNDAQMGIEAREAIMERDGYVKVRKIVITPTRMVYIAPETIMGNRILRNFYKTQTEILRISFRDDDTQPLRPNTAGEKLTEKTVKTALSKGIEIGGRTFRYLGSSNSQMRDNGCYFVYDKVPVTFTYNDKGEEEIVPSKRVSTIRARMGRLDELTNVAKFMARMGQCFTQSRAVNTGLPLNSSNFTYDIAGGDCEQNEKEAYTYSDGVGQISLEYLKRIAKDLKLPNHPCVIQFRHRGFKGVLALHPDLDAVNELRKKLEFIVEEEKIRDGKKETRIVSKCNDDNGDPYKLLNIRFRYSQMKFHAPAETDFEVVKISGPTPVALNKPFINILDQVSEMQSREAHMRLCDRVEELLHRQLRMMAETLVREKSCRDKLKELPRRVSIDGLSRTNGFTLCTEPYFRSLVKSAVRYMIKKQLNKEQIQIPLDLGRSMFGVVDETGLLQYGQIFVQYHVNASLKTPRPSAAKVVHTGPTLITKNPCISAGDVRMFEAVDIPSLRHLVDVVVFPQHGPRPHPDEMAGSDLDGDEYSVIWDPKLFLERNEQAMKFPKVASVAAKIKMDTLDKDLQEFFVKYVTQDSVGQIANAHLNNSDLWGLESTVAKQVAFKHAQAVDFPKTSVAPATLTKDWETKDHVDENTGNVIRTEIIPPQRPVRKPDFMQSNRDPVYASSRLVGRIYREISHVDTVLALSEERDQQEEVVIDDSIYEEGWEEYEKAALQQMIVYNNEIKALMERYGVASEGEIMSGYMISIRNAISDREADDMSFFNTSEVIETQITDIVRTHRENFFKEFGEIRKLTKVASDRKNVNDDTDNIFEREASCPSPEMRKKAVALYRVTYKYVSEQLDSSARLLSFPWIAYDVLAEIKGTNIRKNSDFIAGLDPVDEMLTTQVKEYAAANVTKFRAKTASWMGQDGKDNGEEAIFRYCGYYDGLSELAFFIVQWAEHEKITIRQFRETHIVLLLIQFCLGHYDELEGVISPIEMGTKPVSPRVCITNIGKIVIDFLQWLSSRSFKRIQCMDFHKPNLGVDGCFIRGEWMPMHLAAVRSFYDLIFSLRVDIPSGDEHVVDPKPTIREMAPFLIELPLNCDTLYVALWIKQQTEAYEVRLRRLDTFDQTRVVVSATGTLLSHAKIRSLLVVPLNIKTSENPQEMSEKFPDFVLAKIKEGARRYDIDVGVGMNKYPAAS